MADSRHFEKLLNRRNLAIKFGTITHFDHLKPIGR